MERVREHIRAGDAFQVVLSQRFEVPTDGRRARPLPGAAGDQPVAVHVPAALRRPGDAVRRRRLLAGGAGDRDRHVGRRPPAGRHPAARAPPPEEDVRLAEELLADPKERAEHVMLVDLARNDLGRVCVPGTVEVPDFMRVEHYSHVMHLVSTVAGEVSRRSTTRSTCFDATFPAGTVSGAPKPRAMEIIESLEPTRRALYAGTVGYVDASGDMDMAIAIRTAVLHQGRAYVQAGAGIVADSDPATRGGRDPAQGPRGALGARGGRGAAGAPREPRGARGRARELGAAVLGAARRPAGARADRRRPGVGAR